MMYLKNSITLVLSVILTISITARAENSKKYKIKHLPADPRFSAMKRPDKTEAARILVRAQEIKRLEKLGNASVAWLTGDKQSNTVEINKVIGSLLAEPNAGVSVYFSAAKIANLCGQPEKAISILENVIAKHGQLNAPGLKEPVELIANNWIGSIARHSGDNERASRAYETIIEKSKKLQGLKQKGYIMQSNMHLADMAIETLKDNVLAKKRLDEVEKTVKSIEKNGKAYEWEFIQDWVKFKKSAIKNNGKSKARQQLTTEDLPRTIVAAIMTAYSQLSLSHFLGEVDSSVYDGNRKNRKILNDAFEKHATVDSKISNDRKLAKLLLAIKKNEKKKYKEAEKHYLDIYEEDSYLSPIAGAAFAKCKKKQGKNIEADDFINKVKSKYPGYEPAIDKIKKTWK